MSVLNNNNNNSPVHLDDEEETQPQVPEALISPGTQTSKSPPVPVDPALQRIQEYATRDGITGKQGFEPKNVVLIGGVLALAIGFFLFAQFTSKKPAHPATQVTQASKTQPQQPRQQASLTPNVDPYHNQTTDNSRDKVSVSDIERTRHPNYKNGTPTTPPPSEHPPRSLDSVPPFKATQQTFHDPEPYGTPPPQPAAATQQEQNALKEASLVFVRNPQTQTLAHHNGDPGDSDVPVLQLKEGTRIQAHLESEASSAIHIPVVAVVDYTYAIGDQILVPAGARVFGKLTQADSSGDVGIEFTEIQTLDGAREKISAVGAALDMGPIKGNVYGKHEGRSFLVRAASGIGSVASMVVGNNMNEAYSPSDMIRERAATNIGMAGDNQIQMINANTHIIVAVPANTKIYVVWTAEPKADQSNRTP
jgi:hypothetical protein